MTFDGPTLIFDYFINQWSTWTNHKTVDGVIFDGSFTFAKNNGSVYQQNKGITFYDGYVSGRQVPYSMEMTTHGSLASNLGYQTSIISFLLFLDNIKGHIL